MKKTLIILIIAASIVVVAGLVTMSVIALKSPEAALAEIAIDVKNEGISGLKDHMSDSLLSRLHLDSDDSESPLITMVKEYLEKVNYFGIPEMAKEKTKWELGEIKEDGDDVRVTFNFNYDNKLTGKIKFKMSQEDGEWKISSFGIPSIKRVKQDKETSES